MRNRWMTNRDRFRWLPAPLLRPLMIIVALLCIMSLPAAAKNDEDPPADVEKLLESILASQENTSTLEGRFTQLKTMALFKDPERSSGKFSYRRPDLMRLDYETPSRVILLLEGDHLTTYYPELKEAERFDVRKQKKRVFDHLIGESGIGQLQKNFVITIGPSADKEVEAPAAEGATQHLHLTPRRRQLKRRIDCIDLWVRAEDFAPVQYFIREKSGDTTLFRLDQVRVNGDVPEDLFTIDFPDDVTVSVRTGEDESEDEQ